MNQLLKDQMFYSRERRLHLKNKTIKIYGPPGTGKTTTLLDRVEKLISRGIKPRDMAYLSFTNKAVNEARTRAFRKFVGCTDDDLRNFRTIHSFCRQNFKQVPIINPDTDMVEFAETLGLPKLRFENYNGHVVWNDWSLRVYDKSRNRLIHPDDQYKEEKIKRVVYEKFRLIIEAYEEYKTNHRVDFTDMIEEYIEKAVAPELNVLIVDEAQDLTPLQWKLIYKLAENSKRIYIAGDDDQAIYEWNGADVDYFNDFPGKDFILKTSYRIPKAIHDFSQYLATYIRGRKKKDFIPKINSGNIITYQRLKDIQFNASDSWMILGRTNEIVEELKNEAKTIGLFFQDSKGSKSFDINKWRAIKIWNQLMKGNRINKEQCHIVYTYINEIAYGWRSLDSKKWTTVPNDREFDYNFLSTEAGLHAAKDDWTNVFNRNFPETDKFYFNKLIENEINPDLDSEVIIDTIHSIKGGEAKDVVIYEKSNWPAHLENKVGKDRSSEYRVWYVGITRAKQNLHILRSNHQYMFPLCRMLNEIRRNK
jgi:DNA helicase II / ATP-dependent DNA helicase PcrA